MFKTTLKVLPAVDRFAVGLMLLVAANIPRLIPKKAAQRVLCTRLFRYNPRDNWGDQVHTAVWVIRGASETATFCDDQVACAGVGKNPVDLYLYRCAVGKDTTSEAFERYLVVGTLTAADEKYRELRELWVEEEATTEEEQIANDAPGSG